VQFVFDHHTLDTERRELLRGGATIAMQPQVFDVLLYLLQNREAAGIGSWTPTASTIWKRSAGRDWNSFGSTARRAAARRACLWSFNEFGRSERCHWSVSIGTLQLRACLRSLVQAVLDLAAADPDIPQFPVAELAQGNALRLTLVTRDRSGDQAIHQAA